MNEPLVSVIVATRDRPAYWRDLLDALAVSTYARLEAVIIDDGSPAQRNWNTMRWRSFPRRRARGPRVMTRWRARVASRRWTWQCRFDNYAEPSNYRGQPRSVHWCIC